MPSSNPSAPASNKGTSTSFDPVHRLIWRNWYRDQTPPTPETG